MMLVAVRFVWFGSRNTARPLAVGGSPEWSLASPSKYSCWCGRRGGRVVAKVKLGEPSCVG